MKRFNLIFISLLLLLGSCSKEMREDNTTLEQSSIGFWSYVGSSTRAIDRIDTNFDNFSVIAYTLDGEGDLEYEYIPRSTVSRTPTESLDSWGDWKIANNATYYWPLSTPLSFFAFYPTDATPFVDMKSSTSEKYVPYIDYENSFFGKNQPDMIVATKLAQTKSEAAEVASPVNLTFSHIMTKVNFAVKGDDENLTFVVTELKINAHHKGEFIFDLGYNDSSRVDADIETGTASSSVGSWSVYELETETDPDTLDTEGEEVTDNREFLYFENDDEPIIVGPNVLDEDGNPVFEMTLGGENSLMMIPQTLPSNAEISVTYYINYKDYMVVREQTRTVSMADVVWAMGNNFLYRLTLPSTDVKEIEVYVDNIIDWTVEGNVIIYGGEVTVESLVVNDYFDEATYDEEDAGLVLDIYVEDYDSETNNNESEAGVVGDITVDDYGDDGDYDESDSGVVGDVTVEDYDSETDNNESESGVVGDITVEDYNDDDDYDESDSGVVGDVTVEDYDSETDNNESESGVVGDVNINDYVNKGNYDESDSGVVGDIIVEGYDDTTHFNESESGVVGDVNLNDYTDKDEFNESEGGVVGDIIVDDYDDTADFNEDDSGVVGDINVGDYTDSDSFDEEEGGVVGDTTVEDYDVTANYNEDESGVVKDTEVNDYTESKNENLDDPDDPYDTKH